MEKEMCKTNKILCVYKGQEKIINSKNKIVYFKNKSFEVKPELINFSWYTKGIHRLFPTFIAKINYKD